MAIEKMNVARISGNLEMLDKTLDEICSAGVFQPESAESFYSAGMGLIPFDDENIASQRMAELEALAANAGIHLRVRGKYDDEGDAIKTRRFSANFHKS